MEQAEINTMMKTLNVEALSEALTAKSVSDGMLPMECKWSCQVKIGADGKPELVCGFVC